MTIWLLKLALLVGLLLPQAVFFGQNQASGGSTPPTFVNSGHTNTGGGTCTITASLTLNQIVFAGESTTSPPSTMTIVDTDVTWTQISASPYTSSALQVTAGWIGIVSNTNATSSIQLKSSNTANWLSCAAMWFSPGSLAGTEDKTATANYSATTSLTSGTTATTTTANEISIGLFGMTAQANVHPTFTAGGSYTNILYDSASAATFNSAIALEEQVLSSTGTQIATATSSDTGDTGGGIVVTIK